MLADAFSPSHEGRERLRIVAGAVRAPVGHAVFGREYERGLVVVSVVLVEDLVDLLDYLVHQNDVGHVIAAKKKKSRNSPESQVYSNSPVR